MTYTDIIIHRIVKKRKILVEPNDLILVNLKNDLDQASHKEVIQFIFSVTKSIIKELKSLFPDLLIIDNAMKDAQKWAYGEVKMGVVKPQILAIHRLAKTANSPYDAALLHAYGQGLAVIHSKKHAMGLPIYELTALILHTNGANYEQKITEKVEKYISTMRQIKSLEDTHTYASFIRG